MKKKTGDSEDLTGIERLIEIELLSLSLKFVLKRVKHQNYELIKVKDWKKPFEMF